MRTQRIIWEVCGLLIAMLMFSDATKAQTYGALAIGEFVDYGNGLASWAWIDDPNAEHARQTAYNNCNRPQANPFNGYKRASHPRRCHVQWFNYSAATVGFYVNNQLQYTEIYQAGSADGAAALALAHACRIIAAGTPIRVHWARNHTSPYPAAWDQAYAAATHSWFDAFLTCATPGPSRGGGA